MVMVLDQRTIRARLDTPGHPPPTRLDAKEWAPSWQPDSNQTVSGFSRPLKGLDIRRHRVNQPLAGAR